MLKIKKFNLVVIILVISAMVVSFTVLKVKQFVENKYNETENKINIWPNQDDKANSDLISKLSGENKIKKFNNYEEVKNFLETQTNNGSDFGAMVKTRGGMATMEAAITPMVNDKMSAAPSAVAEGSMGVAPSDSAVTSNDYSKTNVQVEGVDEADIIKTDGNYIYAVVYNNLYIIKAYPGEQSEIISKIEFKSRPQNIYISGQNLVVYGNDDKIYATELYRTFRRQNSYTFLKVFDISDKKNPKQVRDLNFEGNYFDSRLIGDYVYFVTNNYNYYTVGDSIIPQVMADGQVLPTKCAGAEKCFAPSVYYFDIPYDSYNFTNVTAINIKNNEEAISGDIYLTSSAQTMYVSPENVYITYTKYISEYDLQMEIVREFVFPRLSADEQTKITKIEAIEDAILTPAEKKAKIQQIFERFISKLTSEEQASYEKELGGKMKQKYNDLSKELEKTVIYKIAVDKNKMEYKAMGEVTGSVLNQFSMDENNGYFRIATTRNQTWSQYEEANRSSYNNLYILDKDLKTVGRIEDLATGERIYSVRFMGERAYMVTFKQTDPLFVIDVSTPTAPKVLGELKVPGFSTYLHPYDENTLIGFGKDAEDQGDAGVKTKGLKLALFDVKDVKAPKVSDTYIMGDMGSDSIALYDHKAFLFSKEKNLLSLPVTLRKSSGENYWGDISFGGAMVFKINNNKFELLGKIDHSDGGKVSASDIWDGYNYYDNTVKRSLYINDSLYTFSNRYLKINKLSDLSAVKTIELNKESKEDFKVVN